MQKLIFLLNLVIKFILVAFFWRFVLLQVIPQDVLRMLQEMDGISLNQGWLSLVMHY
ncbi:hypothetical protein CsSME_00018850 [Camellia sinensis var. sinensis]